jgi:hypothetical protein
MILLIDRGKIMHLDFVESNNVDGLDEIFKFLDFFGQFID